jgi:hypothetical protein
VLYRGMAKSEEGKDDALEGAVEHEVVDRLVVGRFDCNCGSTQQSFRPIRTWIASVSMLVGWLSVAAAMPSSVNALARAVAAAPILPSGLGVRQL